MLARLWGLQGLRPVAKEGPASLLCRSVSAGCTLLQPSTGASGRQFVDTGASARFHSGQVPRVVGFENTLQQVCNSHASCCA